MLRGVLLFSILFLGTIPIFVLFLLCGVPILLLPYPARVALRGPQIACGRLWVRFSTTALRFAGIPAPQLEGDACLKPDGQYLVLCNHRSWTDIMVLLQLFGPRMPFPRFLAKRQMLWIPFIGVAIWMLDFPLLRRASAQDSAERSRRDREQVARCCQRLGSGAYSLVIYPEGTRFTADKHRIQQSAYRHLLQPRAGGLGVALEHLGRRLDGVVDVTLAYTPADMSYWDYLCGRAGKVRAHVTQIPVPPELLDLGGEVGRQALQRWLNNAWREKDRRLQQWCEPAEDEPL